MTSMTLDMVNAGTRSGTAVKICGLQEAAHAHAAVAAGADLLGFILASSRRQVTPSAIRSIRDALPGDADRPRLVGVFANASPDEINSAVAIAGLDAVQLSGDESPEVLDEIEVPVIKSLRLPLGASEADLASVADLWLDHPRPAWRLHLDAHVDGAFGGTGTLSDWSLAAIASRRYAVLLAGGLTPTNVGEAIAAVAPWGVDVSSGVEEGGVKHPEKIAAFITAAKASGQVSR